jgi:hypothetical protein
MKRWGSQSTVWTVSLLSWVAGSLPAGVKPFGPPPLQFEANRGQADPAARFLARTPGYQLLLEDDAAVLVAPNDGATVRLRLSGAHRHPRLYGGNELPGKVNYLPTGDPKSWVTNIPTYASVKYESVYEGIDLVYYGRKELLEYDFVVAPGADPTKIAFRLEDADDVQIGSRGELVLKTARGDLHFGAPEVYQPEADGTRRAIQGKYVIRGAREAGFEIAAFDRSKPLVIDPVLTYSTFVGSSGDSFTAMTADSTGNVYLAGRSTGGMTIQKQSSDGTTQLYRTILGSGFSFTVQSIAVDSTGKLYMTGTAGPGLPTTAGAFQTTAPNGQHAFVAVVNSAGSALTYCSFLTSKTSTASDQSNSIAVDSTGKVYITGAAGSSSFPTTAGVFQTTSSSSGLTGFVAKFDPTKSGAASLVYSTYLGGATTQTAEEGIAVDSTGNAYIVGIGGVDFPTTASAFHYTGISSAQGGVYVTKLNSTATAPLTYSAYLGFQSQGGTAIALDGSGDAYVTGLAGATDFPTTAGAYQTNFPGAYVSELNSTGTSLVYSTFLPGPSEAPSSPLSTPTSIALTPGCVSACNAYVIGFTSAFDFPAVNAIQSFNDGPNDTFIVELSGNGTAALLSTYLGGSSDESNQGLLHFPSIAVTSTGDAVIAGFTSSSDFPVTLTTVPARFNYAARITSTASAKALVIPSSLTFPAQAVPVPTPTPLTVTLRNMGSATMTITSIVPAGDYSQSNTCGASITAGANCVISVTFTPTKSGSRTGTITITSSATNSPTVVNLTGTGQDGSYINLTPANLAMGSPPVGSAAPSQSVTLSNIGDQALTISGFSIGGTNPTDFFESSNCPASVASNHSCTVNTSFLPTQVGFRTGQVFVSSNTNGQANSTINMTGTGAGIGTSQLTLAGSGLVFNSQAVGTTSPQQTLTVTNTGNVPVTISMVTTTGDYVLTGCAQFGPANVNPGATCTVTVKFAPTAAGARTGTVTITDNTPAGTHTFTLTGTGVADSQTLSITPSALVFANQSVGQPSHTIPIMVTNTGTFAVTFDRVVESGDFQITSNGCASLRPATSCTINVLFNPTTAGSRTGAITMTDTATGSPHTVNLSGTGVTDVMTATITPGNLAFGSQPLGLASSSQNVVLTNTGDVPINPVISITGTNSGDFPPPPPCGPVAPARFCTISVTFTPTATGARSATLTVTDEAGTQSVSLAGTGIAATFSIAFVPSSMTFQAQAKNVPSPPQNLQVVSTGDEPITFPSNPVATGPYSISNSCFQLNNTNNACSVSVTFTPTATGAQNGTITFTDNATGSPQVVNITGSGVATAPTITTSPSGLAFTPQLIAATSSPQTVTVSNTTASPVTGVSFAITGDFAFSTNSCGTTINANSSCSFGVTFKPTASGTRTGTVTITETSPSGTQKVNLAGFGVTSSLSVVLRENSLTFPDQVMGTTSGNQNITLTNTGTAPVTVSNVSVTGTEFAITPNCTTLGPNSSCTVGVTFTPSAAGNRTATVTITDNAPGSPRNITVSGKGLTPVQGIAVSTPTMVFANQVVTTSSINQQNLIVTNTGNAQVTISSVALSGTNSADYSISNSCPISPSTLPPGPSGNTCTVGVTFTPTAAGTRTATIKITDSSPTSPHTITLTGTGVTATKTVAVTPTAVKFDPQIVGTSSGFTQTVTVFNTGTFTVTFTSVTVTGAFSLSNGCVGGLAPGTLVTPSSCAIQLQFTPTVAGNATGTLTITDNATGSPQKVTLTGTGIASTQSISLSQNSVVFDQEVVGTASPQMVVYYYNQSNVAVNITNVVLTGADYSMTNACSGSIGANTFCTIKITFKPTAAGTRTGTVVITDSAPGSPRTINLSGTGVAAAAPAATLSPTSLTFGNQTEGTTSAPQTITLTNTGETSLTVTGITITGTNASDFAQTNNCPASLVAGFSCAIAVTFSPSGTGARSATLNVADSAAGSPQTAALSGTGLPGSVPAVTLTPPSLTFSNVPVNTTSAPQTSTLKNTGAAALTITNIAVTGGISGDFAQTNNCPASVAVGGTCTINVTFTPSSVIDQTAAVTITDNAPTSPQSLNLAGNGTAPAVNLSATTLTFASQTVGTTSAAKTVTLENVGNLALTISGIVASGDFHVVSNTCPASLGPGLTCTFGVTFKPTATGARTGLVTITDNAGDSPQFISLSGTGS